MPNCELSASYYLECPQGDPHPHGLQPGDAEVFRKRSAVWNALVSERVSGEVSPADAKRIHDEVTPLFIQACNA